jgi:hypothetical protein
LTYCLTATFQQNIAAPANLQRDRLIFAQHDLEAARAEDLAQLPAADLIILIERMRGRLDDMVKLVKEITGLPPSP